MEYKAKNNETLQDIKFSSKVKWIWAQKSDKEDWCMFRKKFFCNSEIISAKLLITAGSFHETYINGDLVLRGPGRSYNFSKVYDEVDVISFINSNEDNIISILSQDISNSGILAELIITEKDGQVTNVCSDSSWLTKKNKAFKCGMPSIAPLLGNEEVFDRNLDIDGWKCHDFDDSRWTIAKEIGPVGTFPWTNMEKSTIGLLSNDEVFPKGFIAIELAELRIGYHLRLSSKLTCTNAFVTEINVVKDTLAFIWFKSNDFFVTLNGEEIKEKHKLIFKKGSNILCCCAFSIFSGEIEFIIECSEKLTFLADNLLNEEGVDWAVLNVPSKTVNYPWHDKDSGITGQKLDIIEFAPEILNLINYKSILDFTDSLIIKLEKAEKKEPSILFEVETQKFYKVRGGYTHPDIEKAQPRFDLGINYKKPIENESNMLHGNPNYATVNPQIDKDVHFVVDFGKEVIGYVDFILNAPEGTIVDIECFEVIDGRGIYWMGYQNSFRYICKRGQQKFTSHVRRGFRYISITIRNYSEGVKIQQISCFHSSYPVEKIGSFNCNDSLLEKIFNISQNTASLCMLDTYVDCPGHEQNFWVGDARITALINLLSFGAYNFNQRSIKLVGQSLLPDWDEVYKNSDYRINLPIAAFPNYPEGGLPMWTFMWILQCYDHYMYGGSIEDLKENYGYVKETLRRCKILTNQRGLFDMPGAWNLIEWGNNDLSPYGEVTANNAFLAQCYRVAQKMSKALGYEDVAKEYMKEADNIIEAINKYCWDDTRKAYVDTIRDKWAYNEYLNFCKNKCIESDSYDKYKSSERISEQSNTLALLFECVPEKRINSILEIIERVKDGKYVFGAPAGRSFGPPDEKEAPGGIVAIGSPFFLFFTLEVLFKYSNNIVLDVIRRDWGKMISKGTTTCWETFKMNDINWTRSICHAWSAAPAVYLPTNILGLRPLEPGYSKFIIEPFAGNLEWARGSVATPYGPIYVSWKKNNEGKIIIEWSSPDECKIVKQKNSRVEYIYIHRLEKV